LRDYAVARGAADAAIISSRDVIIDPRARLKCLIPRCYMAGMCAHCPPHGYSVDEVRDAVSRTLWGVFFRVRVKSSIIAAPFFSGEAGRKVPRGYLTRKMDRRGNLMNLGASYLQVYTIAALLAKRALASGFPAALKFAAGPCRDVLCHMQPSCRVLTAKQECRNPELSAPSMESCGMDAYTMAARAGWDLYPIGASVGAERVPGGSLMGLVLWGRDDAPILEALGTPPRGADRGKPSRDGAPAGASTAREAFDFVRALRQCNITPLQMPNMLREGRLWLRVFGNFRELQGSWPGAARLGLKVFSGRPMEEE
jgi:predicted metal-binding protein